MLMASLKLKTCSTYPTNTGGLVGGDGGGGCAATFPVTYHSPNHHKQPANMITYVAFGKSINAPIFN